MGGKAMERIASDPPCRRGQLACLLAIAKFANDSGVAWPGMDTIGYHAGMTERAARKNIQKLIEAELIIVERGGGRNRSNRYQINCCGFGGTAEDAENVPFVPVIVPTVRTSETRNKKPGINPKPGTLRPETRNFSTGESVRISQYGGVEARARDFSEILRWVDEPHTVPVDVEPDALYIIIRRLIGYSDHELPIWWRPSLAVPEIEKWREKPIGLTPGQIIEMAMDRIKKKGAPESPKAWDQFAVDVSQKIGEIQESRRRGDSPRGRRKPRVFKAK